MGRADPDAAEGDSVGRRVGDRLAADLIELDPLTASDWGVASTELPALSPDWFVQRRELFAGALREFRPADDSPAVTMIRERAQTEVDWINSGEAYSEVQAALDSPLFRLRHCFDEMPMATVENWQGVARRLEQVPAALKGFRLTLSAHRHTAPPPRRRQVLATADTLAAWAKDSAGGSTFERLVAPSRQVVTDRLPGRLIAAARAAANGFDEMSAYLRTDVASWAVETDAVGTDRFEMWSRRYAGSVIGRSDYDWAAQRLGEIGTDQSRLAREVERLGAAATLNGAAEHAEWVENLIKDATRRLASVGVFGERRWPDIRVRLRDATDSGQAYYAPAPEATDFPASVWVAGGDGPHHIEYEKTVVFHESVPGHHVESSVQRATPTLSRFQRLTYLPAHSEGWALYAEGLADEVGLIDTPHAQLGCRGSQALRLASLLVDVGLHTGLAPPPAVQSIVGNTWTSDGSVRLIAAQGLATHTAEWWLTNMIGRPAHRASYAAGERAWLSLRADSLGRGTTLADFHLGALTLGPLGLEQLREAAV